MYVLYSISFSVPLCSSPMWGSALVTVCNIIPVIYQYLVPLLTSPSSWSTSLNTPWAAGCWGPKLSWRNKDIYNLDMVNSPHLHVPDKLLWLGQAASVGHQLGVVLLLGDEEVPLLVLLRDGAVIVSIPGNIIVSRRWLALALWSLTGWSPGCWCSSSWRVTCTSGSCPRRASWNPCRDTSGAIHCCPRQCADWNKTTVNKEFPHKE